MFVTLDQLKEQLNITLSNTTQDLELTRFASAACRVVERLKAESVEMRDYTQEMVLHGATVFLLKKVPVAQITSIQTVDGQTVWDPADFHADPNTGLVAALSGSVDGWVTVTYRAGYDTPPDDYVEAALIIAEHLWKTQRGIMQPTAGGFESEQAETQAAALTTGAGYAIPYRALELLGAPYPGFA